MRSGVMQNSTTVRGKWKQQKYNVYFANIRLHPVCVKLSIFYHKFSDYTAPPFIYIWPLNQVKTFHKKVKTLLKWIFMLRIFFGEVVIEFIQIGLGELFSTMNLLASSKKMEKCNKTLHKPQMKILTLFYPRSYSFKIRHFCKLSNAT